MQPGHGYCMTPTHAQLHMHLTITACSVNPATLHLMSQCIWRLVRLQCCRFLGDSAIGPHAVVTLISFGVMFASLTEVKCLAIMFVT